MSDTQVGVTLSKVEATAMLELLDLVTDSAKYVFCWDGPNDANNPGISGWLKLFKAAGRPVPRDLKG